MSFIIFFEGPEACGKTSLLNAMKQALPTDSVYQFVFSDYQGAARIKEKFFKAGNDNTYLEDAIVSVFEYFNYVSKEIQIIQNRNPNKTIYFLVDSYIWRTFVLQGYLNDKCELFYRLYNEAKSKGEMNILYANHPEYKRIVFILDAKEKVINVRHMQRLKTNTAEVLDEFFTARLADVKEGYKMCIRNKDTALSLSTISDMYLIDGSGSIAWAEYQAFTILQQYT